MVEQLAVAGVNQRDNAIDLARSLTNDVPFVIGQQLSQMGRSAQHANDVFACGIEHGHGDRHHVLIGCLTDERKADVRFVDGFDIVGNVIAWIFATPVGKRSAVKIVAVLVDVVNGVGTVGAAPALDSVGGDKEPTGVQFARLRAATFIDDLFLLIQKLVNFARLRDFRLPVRVYRDPSAG